MTGLHGDVRAGHGGGKMARSGVQHDTRCGAGLRLTHRPCSGLCSVGDHACSTLVPKETSSAPARAARWCAVATNWAARGTSERRGRGAASQRRASTCNPRALGPLNASRFTSGATGARRRLLPLGVGGEGLGPVGRPGSARRAGPTRSRLCRASGPRTIGRGVLSPPPARCPRRGCQ